MLADNLKLQRTLNNKNTNKWPLITIFILFLTIAIGAFFLGQYYTSNSQQKTEIENLMGIIEELQINNSKNKEETHEVNVMEKDNMIDINIVPEIIEEIIKSEQIKEEKKVEEIKIEEVEKPQKKKRLRLKRW
eukprot:UN29800